VAVAIDQSNYFGFGFKGQLKTAPSYQSLIHNQSFCFRVFSTLTTGYVFFPALFASYPFSRACHTLRVSRALFLG